MNGWAGPHLDLIHHVDGIALVVLGAVAVVLPRRASALPFASHLVWLGAFGMLHGALEYVEGGRQHIHPAWLDWLIVVLLVASFVALFEFGRRTWNAFPGPMQIPAPPVYLLLAAGVTALAWQAADPANGIAAGARYFIGVPGALLSGIALLVTLGALRSSANAPNLASWLRTGALALFAYAGLVPFLPAIDPQFPSWLPTTGEFMGVTGVPVQLLRALSALTLALAFVMMIRNAANAAESNLLRVVNILDGFVYRHLNDKDWTLQFVTAGIERLTGYPESAFKGRHAITFGGLIHPEDASPVRERVRASLDARQPFEIGYRILTREGVERWVYERGRGVDDTDGRLAFIEGYVIDDSRRKCAEHELERERDFATSVVNTASTIIVVLDPTGQICFANRYFEHLTGYRLDEILGREWFETFLPERDRERVRARFHGDDLARPKRGKIGTILLRGGEERMVEWNNQAMRDPGGTITGLLAIGQDVTARVQAETELKRLNIELRDLAERVPVGVYTFRTGPTEPPRFDYVSPRFCQLIGIPMDDVLRDASNVFDRVHPDDREAHDHLNADVARSHRAFRWEGRFIVDGQPRWLRIESNPIPQAHGETLWNGVVMDVTDRHNAEASLSRLNRELEDRVMQRTAALDAARMDAERANEAKSEFLSRMSHELRTPLNAVIGFGRLLENDPAHPLADVQNDHVREILNAGNHLLELINEVLDLSRIESGKLDLNLEPVELAPLVEACCRQLLPQAAERGISLEFAIPDSCAVQADHIRLRQILLNLMSNAVKYNKPGGQVRTGCTPVDEGWLRIGVSDTGTGISPDSIPRLFSPFERLESAYSGIEGTGIGLALSKVLTEAMGGRIGVDSVPGKGSTFWVDLPQASGAIERRDAPPMPPRDTSSAVPRSDRPRRVLYIEDNPANLRLVRKILATRDDIELLEAGDAETGLDIAASSRPDLVLLDLNLPGIDGFTALARLRQTAHGRSIPVIAVTANAMQRDVERGKRAGFNAYLTKPIEINRFLEIVDQQLTGHPEHKP